MRRPVLLFAAALLVLAACSSGDDSTDGTTAAGGESTTSTAEGTPDTVDTGDLPRFDTVAEIGDTLGCSLEYDGITDADREYSTCVFEEEQALIYVYTDPTFVDQVVATGPPALAYGQNWTVEVETPETAQLVADALNGAVAAPAPAD